MLRLNHHGGHCCGIRHIHGFYNTNLRDMDNELSRVSTDAERRYSVGFGGDHGLQEIVLTASQIRNRPELAEKIQDRGFKYVSRFKNPNSGNICYVFHRTIDPSPRSKIPFKIINK